MTWAIRRSPLEMKSSMALILAGVKLALTCLRPLKAARSIFCFLRNSDVLTLCHWNGVWGFGEKLEMVTLTARCHLPLLHSSCSHLIVS